MALKRAKQSTGKIKNLKVKGVAADNAKHVKGGPIDHPYKPQEAGMTNLQLPAVQKVRG